LKGHDTAETVNPAEYLSTTFKEDKYLNALKRHEILIQQLKYQLKL